MVSFGSGWRSGSRTPVGSGGMLVTGRPYSLLDLLAGCAAHSLWRLLHDDEPGLPVGDLLLDSPVWHCVRDRFVLERRGTDVDPQDAALQGEERAAAVIGVKRRGVGDDAVASSDGIRPGDGSDGRDDRCLRTAVGADDDDLRANRRGRPSRQATG